MLNPIRKSLQLGRHTLTLETGEIARQADGAVLVSLDDTVVLVTVVSDRNVKPGQDFFPLTVDYQEKTYAAGKIPGGFFKREGRPSEQEILTCRLIDRPIRPLFPEGFYHEVQIVATVLSIDPEIPSDIPAIIGASAALAIAGVPFDGPLGAARVGYIDGQYVLNPTNRQLNSSKLDLVIAGTDAAVLMVESEAQELSEEILLGAIAFGHEHSRRVIELIDSLVEEAGKPLWEWAAPAVDTELVAAVEAAAGAELNAAYSIQQKQERSTAVDAIRARTLDALRKEGDDTSRLNTIKNTFFNLEASIVRGRILNSEPRIDGRNTRTIRPITIRTGVLPRVHGSALFTRGETQALAVATLGTSKDEQVIDALHGDYRDRFMLHYNMPPYATGECGRVGSPKRREVGHGRLAKRALVPVLPTASEFAYSMRVVSEIMESNGSSSMASVCGASLALMDAGVPLKAPVAGIAMGLIKEGNRFAVLSDILGDEDHLGDMDFKVAGTEKGITALQMDIKIQGITQDIMAVALKQAAEGRLHILGLMNQTLPQSRTELSSHAPKMISFKIPSEKIRDVIGKGGATIRALTEETGASIELQDDGTVTVSAVSGASVDAARAKIEAITADVEIGKIYEGTVIRLLDFGAIINILPGKDGLLHVSQIANERVNNVGDYVKEGQVVRVKVVEMDDKGKIRLSIRAILNETATPPAIVALDQPHPQPVVDALSSAPAIETASYAPTPESIAPEQPSL